MFENLNVQDTTLPAVTRNRDAGPNPFLDHVGASYRDSKGKSVVIPAEMGSAAVQKIRQAAEKLNIGVRVVVTDKAGKKLDAKALIELREKKSKAQITVLFQGQDKRNYTGKKKDTAPATPAPAAPAPAPAPATPAPAADKK